MTLRNLILLSLIVLYTSCGDQPAATRVPQKDPYPLIPSQSDKNLNISVLIDLSDRINSSTDSRQPGQSARDISVIQILATAIKKNVAAHGSFSAKARLNVYFHPEPSNKQIRDIARDLSATWVSSNDIAVARQNKLTYQQLETKFTIGLQDIYQMAQSSGQYPGADIWRFMKDEARIKCIEPDTSYRNILVILTDGYLYYQNGKQQLPNSNRYNYIERGTSHFSKFRDPNLLSLQFDKDDYGLIPAATGLENLEILVLECRPEETYPQDFEIMKKYWCKWFREMGVKHAEVYKSQQPAYHEKMIAGFLRKSSGICQ